MREAGAAAQRLKAADLWRPQRKQLPPRSTHELLVTSRSTYRSKQDADYRKPAA